MDARARSREVTLGYVVSRAKNRPTQLEIYSRPARCADIMRLAKEVLGEQQIIQDGIAVTVELESGWWSVVVQGVGRAAEVVA